jgi:hypothetical protein
MTLGEHIENLIGDTWGRTVVEGQSDLPGQQSLMHNRSLFRAQSSQKDIAVGLLDPGQPDESSALLYTCNRHLA